jgi:hypothetical protein
MIVILLNRYIILIIIKGEMSSSAIETVTNKSIKNKNLLDPLELP